MTAQIFRFFDAKGIMEMERISLRFYMLKDEIRCIQADAEITERHVVFLATKNRGA